jgi:hypothetical protein
MIYTKSRISTLFLYQLIYSWTLVEGMQKDATHRYSDEQASKPAETSAIFNTICSASSFSDPKNMGCKVLGSINLPLCYKIPHKFMQPLTTLFHIIDIMTSMSPRHPSGRCRRHTSLPNSPCTLTSSKSILISHDF